MARRENSFGITSVEGFNCRDSFLTPAMLGVLCSAGADIHDLDITRVLETTEPTKIKKFLRGVVSTLVDIQTAARQDGDAPAVPKESNQDAPSLHVLDNGFKVLEESPTRSVAMEFPYTDSKGVSKTLVAAAVMGVNGTMSAGLHTDLVSRRSR